jgi:hypothetical protein
MPRQRHSLEEIIRKLREAEVLLRQEHTVRASGVPGLEQPRATQHHEGRIWKREGLKVPARQPKRDRLWLCAVLLSIIGYPTYCLYAFNTN